MKSITISENDLEALLEIDISDLEDIVKDDGRIMGESKYNRRRKLLSQMNNIKEQCDKIIGRIHEYDDKG